MATPAPTVALLNDHRWTLLPTALRRPATGPRALPRTALLERLAACDDPVIALSAPAGYGKSTLLVQWCEADPRPFAWVRGCDGADPAQLLEYTAAAVESLPGVQTPVPATVAGLCRTLAALSQPCVVVLDGAERVGGTSCAAILGAIADHLPPGSQLAVSGRSLPAMPLARLRVEDRVHELDGEALAFTSTESSRLLRGFGVQRREAAELADLTGGWPAAVVLAGRCGGDRRLLRRMLSDYLRTALLERLDDDDRRLLELAAIAGPLSGELAVALSGHDDAAGALDRLCRDNRFLTRGADDRYRLHPLVCGVLAEQLELDGAGQTRALRHAAADWCHANGLPEQAVELAIAAGDLERAAALAGSCAPALAHRGCAETVSGWLEALLETPELTAGGPLPLVGTWISATAGHAAAADRWACIGELGGESSQTAALVRAAVARHGADRMRADAATAARALQPGDELFATAALLEGWAQLLGGRHDDAQVTLTSAGAAAGARGFDDLAALALAGRALCAIERANWADAGDRTAEMLRLLDGDAGRLGTAALGFAVAGRVAAQRGDRVAAVDLLDRALSLVESLTAAMPWLAVRARVEAARLAVALGRPEVALPLGRAAQALPGRWLAGGTGCDDLPLQALFATGAGDAWAATLSRAELRVLPLLATHLSFREIGERLFVSRNTVKTHAISIYRKLGVSSRADAVARAGELGLIAA